MRLIHYRGSVPNFGDDLNTLLWPALAPDLFAREDGAALLGIGTIIGMPCPPGDRLHVLSAGIGNDPLLNWQDRDVTYWGVRGPISAMLLGLPPDRAMTDGAILTPLAPGFPTAAGSGGGTLIVPHFQSLDVPGWDEVAARTGFTLVDPRGDPHSVIAQIAGARLVLTESLHGAVLADTYGIPWSVFATSGNFGVTKFVDWCASVGLPFRMTPVPPPDARHVLRYGRGPGRWGATRTINAEDALAGFTRRLASAVRGPTLAGRVKARLGQRPALARVLGYTPARTAATLATLAGTTPFLSAPATRDRLQARLMDSLRRIETFNRV